MESTILDQVMDRCRRLLLLVSRRHGLSRVERDEIEQDVRIRLWRALGRGAQLQTMSAAYVYRAAVSAALDLARRQNARRAVPLVEQRDSHEMPLYRPPETCEPWDRLERAEVQEQITRALGELADRRRKVVGLYLLGYVREEIATLLGWSEPTTRNLLYRGLADLRACLTRGGISSS
jgi:RNA polymerase sigma-70 factor (ECF subfamily)